MLLSYRSLGWYVSITVQRKARLTTVAARLSLVNTLLKSTYPIMINKQSRKVITPMKQKNCAEAERSPSMATVAVGLERQNGAFRG